MVFKENKMLCELEEGSLMGALKFNSILPWEIDGDITLHQDNFTAFGEKITELAKQQGYTLVSMPVSITE